MNRRKFVIKGWHVLGILLLAGGAAGGFFWWKSKTSMAINGVAVSNQGGYKTTTVRVDNLSTSATGTGTLVASRTMILGFDSSNNIAEIDAQAQTIAAARLEREQHQRHIARGLDLPETSGLNLLIPRLPAEYQPLVHALVHENNDLLTRVQQRARQNHLLLSRAVELMQRFLGSLLPANPAATYNDAGHCQSNLPQRTVYDAIG